MAKKKADLTPLNDDAPSVLDAPSTADGRDFIVPVVFTKPAKEPWEARARAFLRLVAADRHIASSVTAPALALANEEA